MASRSFSIVWTEGTNPSTETGANRTQTTKESLMNIVHQYRETQRGTTKLKQSNDLGLHPETLLSTGQEDHKTQTDKSLGDTLRRYEFEGGPQDSNGVKEPRLYTQTSLTSSRTWYGIK